MTTSCDWDDKMQNVRIETHKKEIITLPNARSNLTMMKTSRSKRKRRRREEFPKECPPGHQESQMAIWQYSALLLTPWEMIVVGMKMTKILITNAKLMVTVSRVMALQPIQQAVPVVAVNIYGVPVAVVVTTTLLTALG